MAIQDKAQVGFKTESTYGTAVTVDRFLEFSGEEIMPDRQTIRSSGMRSGMRTHRTDRFVQYTRKVSGPLKVQPLSKGFGWWLNHMLGSSATGSTVDSATTHTGTFGSLYNKSFTLQSNRAFNPGNGDQAFTWAGCKIASWDVACAVGQLLEFNLNIVGQSETTGTALATASYPTGTVEPFSFVGGSVTVAGSSYEVGGFKLSCDNALKVDNQKLKSTGAINQPVEEGLRVINWALDDGDFVDLTQYNRFMSATASGALATMVATFVAPTLIGVSSLPTITITVDNAHFEQGSGMNAGGPGVTMQSFGGAGLWDGTDSPITIAYKTADTTA